MKTHTLLLTSLLLSPAFAAFGQTETLSSATQTNATATNVTDTVPEPSIDLDDLVVVADRPIVQSDGAKLTYNLDEDVSTKGMTLSDALRKVPMVSVDGEGNIRINGQDNFKVYVNGKEDPALTARCKDIFKAMPAESVMKIEVITEPGAKFDAEGTGGILNLVTVSRNSTDGYSGSISAVFSKSQTGASVYGRMKHSRLSMSANFDYANAKLFHQSNWSENDIEQLNSFDSRYQYNRIQQRVTWDYIGGGLNLSYDLSEKDLITANANVYSMRASLQKGGYSLYKVWNADHQLIGSVKRDLHGVLVNTSVIAGASWQHSFSEEGEKLILSYLYNHGYNNLTATLDKPQIEGQTVVTPYELTSNKGYNNEHTIQLDYVKPISQDKHTLDAGGKIVMRRNPAKAFTLWDSDQSESEAAPADRTDIIQKQDIYALYLSYKGKFDNVSVTAGIRYEHTRMGIDYKTGEVSDFTSRLNDVVPNAALTYSFTEASNLRFSYQMRISRPSLKQVNPYEFIYIPTIVEKGNPDLNSERANKLSLLYSNFGRNIGGNVGIEYTVISNSISPFTYTQDDITYSTYANIGRRKSFDIFGYLTWSPLSGLQFSANARLAHRDFSAKKLNLGNSGWTLNYGADINYSLPCRLRINIYGGQSTKSYHLQGWEDGWYYYGFGISRNFLKNNALTLTLTASQFLQSQMSSNAYTATENMINKFTFHNKNWNVGLSISWNFGSLKSDVKKTSRQIENDDKSSVAGQSLM